MSRHQRHVTGESSVPADVFARAASTWRPGAIPLKVPHAPHAPPSRRHSNVAPLAAELTANVAVSDCVQRAGPESMNVSGSGGASGTATCLSRPSPASLTMKPPETGIRLSGRDRLPSPPPKTVRIVPLGVT